MKPNELETLPLKMESLYLDLQNRVMSDVIRRVKKNSSITATADYQINRLVQQGLSTKEINEQIRKSLNYSEKEYKLMLDEVITKDYIEKKSIYEKADSEFIPFAKNEVLQQQVLAIQIQTNKEFANISNSLGFVVKQNGKTIFRPLAEYYQKNLDSAIMDIATGSFSYNDSITRIVREMTNSGLRTIDYGTGATNRVNVAARRAAMTGVGQLTNYISTTNALKLNTNFFEVTRHEGARPDHQKWQGKVYTYEQLQSICGLGTGGGLGGWNCRHSYFPFIPGIDERLYTDKELKELDQVENTPKIYNSVGYTEYDALQRQRALESSMRIQREKIALYKQADTEDLVLVEKMKYNSLMGEYKRFSNSMGLKLQTERIKLDGLGRL